MLLTNFQSYHYSMQRQLEDAELSGMAELAVHERTVKGSSDLPPVPTTNSRMPSWVARLRGRLRGRIAGRRWLVAVQARVGVRDVERRSRTF